MDVPLNNKTILFAPWSGSRKDYYAYQTWYIPLTKIFSNIITFDPQEIMKKYGQKEMNNKFLNLIKIKKPDYVFLWLHFDEFYFETLMQIKDLSPYTKVINYCGDDDTLFYNYSIYCSNFVDYFLVTHKKYIPLYNHKAFLSLSTDTSTFKYLNVRKKYDVTFVGTSKHNRYEIIKYLFNNGINIKIFGGGWEKYSDLKEIYGGSLSSTDLVKVFNQTKINICFTRNDFGFKHINQHPFEIGACKAFMLTEYSKSYSDFFNFKNELITFKDKKDLLIKIKYYLNNPIESNKIANRLYCKIIKNFSKDIEFKHLFNLLSKKNNSSNTNKNFIKLTDYNIVALNLEDSGLNFDKILDKVKNADFIYFKTNDAENLPYREYLQVYSLKYLKKPISLCSYYFNISGIGDSLLFNSNSSLHLTNYINCLNVNQIMVNKTFFLKNFNKFKDFVYGKPVNLFSNKTTAFVSFPLVRVKKINTFNYKDMKDFFVISLENEITSRLYKKTILFDIFIYRLFLLSLFKYNFFLQYFFERIINSIKKFKFYHLFKS